jgi:hypothetical protein
VIHPAAIHPLTPGTPAYAILKVGAIGSIVALRFALTRRSRRQEETATEHTATDASAERQRPAHPVSRKKKRRRRR